MPEISVIILNYNGQKWLSNCLESLKNQTFVDFETILFDNGSLNDALEFSRKIIPGIKIILNKQNLGFADGNNMAACQATGKFLLFLNNDTKLDKDCLKEAYNYAKINGSKLCSLSIFDYNGDPGRINIETNKMGVDILGYPIPSQKVFYADGAALFIEKELFFKLGGFDKKHFMFAEDIDLCWRSQLSGIKICFVEKAKVFHEKGGTMIGSSKKWQKHITSLEKRYFTERNTLRNILKNYGLFALLIIVPFFVICHIIEMIFFLFIGKINLVRNIYLKALYYNIINLKDTLRLRQIIQRERIVSDWKIINNMTYNKFYKLEVFRKIGVPLIK